MNILFDEKTKCALQELLDNGSYEYIRLKVSAVGCGKPAYDIYADIKRENDMIVTIEGIPFVIDLAHKMMCDNTQIKYDKEVYTKGFYVRDL